MIKRIYKGRNIYGQEYIVEEYNNGIKKVYEKEKKIGSVNNWYYVERLTSIDVKNFEMIY